MGLLEQVGVPNWHRNHDDCEGRRSFGQDGRLNDRAKSHSRPDTGFQNEALPQWESWRQIAGSNVTITPV